MLSAFAARSPGLVGWALAGDVCLLVACVLDFVRTPHPARLAPRRELPERVGLSAPFARRVRVAIEGAAQRAAGLELELREEFSSRLEVVARSLHAPSAEAARGSPELFGLQLPAQGDPSGGPDRVRLPASGPIDCVRAYRARRRGVAELGRLRLRLRGPLGLVQRQATIEARASVRVEPPLSTLSRTLRLAASERWHDLGVRRLRRRGGLTEFESLREYVPGDDPRLLDWKALARRDRPMVRQYQEEQGQELFLCVDCGRRMGVRVESGRTRGWTKLDHALDAALELAAVALDKGDRVGVLAFDSRVRAFVPPARGRRQFERLRRAVFDLEAAELESDLAGALRELGLRHARRATTIVLSDVADPESLDEQVDALRAGSRRHRVIFASLDDPVVRRVADGEVRSETSVRAAAFGQRQERARSLRILARGGARVVDALPSEAAGPLLAGWLNARRAGWG